MAMKTNRKTKENKNRQEEPTGVVETVKASRKTKGIPLNDNLSEESSESSESSYFVEGNLQEVLVENNVSTETEKKTAFLFLNSDEVENQIFGEEPQKFEVEDLDFESLKDAILNYNKDSKNFFTGHILDSCEKERREEDSWYEWTKEMMDSVDVNEATMNKALLDKGHSYISEIMEKGCDHLKRTTLGACNDPLIYWKSTLENKITELLSGLKSIKNLIKEKGMKTVWGKIKNRGFFINNARQYFTIKKST